MTSFSHHKWARTPKSEPIVWITIWGCCHVPMDSISMCSNTLHMPNMDVRSSLRCLSASTNDIMPSLWLHKRPRTSKSEPSSVGITIKGYCNMPMDSISICSNTCYMYNLDAGCSLRRLSASTMMLLHRFDSTSDLDSQNLSQVRWA